VAIVILAVRTHLMLWATVVQNAVASDVIMIAYVFESSVLDVVFPTGFETQAA